ncbi:MAG: endonuclease MutS2 [Clostridia bacterium]|nr:endonuclease MutS2 [Clostridia bacterium]
MMEVEKRLELNKIVKAVAAFAVLDESKTRLSSLAPITDLKAVKELLATTEECTSLLYRYGAGKVEYFPVLTDEIKRAKKGSALTCGELLGIAALLRSARIAYKSVRSVPEGEAPMPLVKRLTQNLAFDKNLEEDIQSKIVNEEQVSDFASAKLYSLRQEIKLLNEKIRSKLTEYLTGDTAKYLQEGIVTMRDNRYVLPVRTEYKRSVKGFVHDRSASGATVFIEPEYVLEMNNELRSLTLDEKEEVERILRELSHRVGGMGDGLLADIDTLAELDGFFARAEYGYKTKSTRPAVNDRGIIRIIKGRHPLIEREKVIPVSLSLGENYNFLLISGPNTGGKTVTLKMTGLFCLMAACGLFIPAAEGSEVAVFGSVFCDVGDAQSIEESLSTFSSHVANIIEITENADKDSLVLIDELGGGTDPEEGQALARAVTEYLLKKGAKGIITTHYTGLKEFAYAENGIENASMEFDSKTLQPLYNVKIGIPGASNALLISRRLGLNSEILRLANENLSDGMKRFDNILRQAEDTRIEAAREKEQAEKMRREWEEKVTLLNAEREKLRKEKENLQVKAKSEARRIINERAAEAEEILRSIEENFAKESLSEGDLIHARTLKNRLSDKAYQTDWEKDKPTEPQYIPLNEKTVKTGEKVYVSAMDAEGIIRSLRAEKKEAEVEVNGLRLRLKFAELMQPTATMPKANAQSGKKKEQEKKGGKPTDKVQVVRNIRAPLSPLAELNVIGLTVQEAIAEIDPFLDSAVLSNLETVKIVHGFGSGRLKKGIHEYLRTHRSVEGFRLGIYGEGEGGVTIVKLK